MSIATFRIAREQEEEARLNAEAAEATEATEAPAEEPVACPAPIAPKAATTAVKTKTTTAKG
jgi:hypothetical protein